MIYKCNNKIIYTERWEKNLTKMHTKAMRLGVYNYEHIQLLICLELNQQYNKSFSDL